MGLVAFSCADNDGGGPIRKGADCDSCMSPLDCLSGACIDGVCGGAAACEGGGGGERCGLASDSCVKTSDCCEPLRCQGNVCGGPGAGGEAGGGGDTGGEGGADSCGGIPVGDPCADNSECGPGGRCLADEGGFGFPGGYCTVDPSVHPECCPDGAGRRDMAGGPRYCWKRCCEDATCRVDEGYNCLQGACGPTDEAEIKGEFGAASCQDGQDNFAVGLLIKRGERLLSPRGNASDQLRSKLVYCFLFFCFDVHVGITRCGCVGQRGRACFRFLVRFCHMRRGFGAGCDA